MTEAEIAWLAGILEGEACFDWNTGNRGIGRYPRIRIEMKDRDVIERVAKLCGGGGAVREVKRANPNHSATYRFQVAAKKEVQEILALVYPWMSERRQEQISKLLAP